MRPGDADPAIISFAGVSGSAGVYVLRIRVAHNLRVSFGRFAGGQPLHVPAGVYAYVGSALAPRGATSLAHRLVRHVTRSGAKPPHALRARLVCECARAGLACHTLPRRKTLFWNIDYLLDELEVEVVGVAAIRTTLNLESPLAHALLDEAGVEPLAKGLGAHDTRDVAHVLRIPSGKAWWREFAHRIVCRPLESWTTSLTSTIS